MRSPETVTLHVTFRIVKRGRRKEIGMSAYVSTKRSQPDDALIKALARAFRWKGVLESEEFATIGDLAEQERIAPSYLTRVMGLALLAPEIVETIVTCREGVPDLADVLKPFSVEWNAQRTHFVSST